jgi:hypothetical protein
MHSPMPTIIIFAALCAGVVMLQIFLSKKVNKWPGLILPLIAFFFSLFMALCETPVYQTTGFKRMTESGEVIEQVVEGPVPIGSTSSIIFSIVTIFLMFNIPTAILLAIYAACREKRKRSIALQKMSVQDLE